VANNNYPQITSVTSESLQAQIRNLLPSQEGFGTDLMAQNVIVPVIDLTAAAEGSNVPVQLQEAFSFTDITAVEAENNTVVIANTPGFYRLLVSFSLQSQSGSDCSIVMSDGATTKVLLKIQSKLGSSYYHHEVDVLTVFLDAGDSVSAVSSDAACFVNVAVRQIADVNGVLTNPNGFSPQ